MIGLALVQGLQRLLRRAHEGVVDAVFGLVFLVILALGSRFSSRKAGCTVPPTLGL